MMKKVLMVIIVLLLSGAALAEGEWGDISTGGNATDNAPAEEAQAPTEEDSSSQSQNTPMQTYDSGTAKTKYTTNFYLALGLGTLAILVVLYAVYLFIRGPNVRWKKPKPIKQ